MGAPTTSIARCARALPIRTPKERLVAVVVLLALVPVSVWWAERIVDTQHNGFFAGETTFPIGVDFVVLHTAGALLVDGQSSDIYNPDRFQDAVAERTGVTVTGNAVFANPPPMAMVTAGLAWLEWRTAWLLWTAASLAALALAIHLLGMSRPWLAFTIVLLTMPIYLAVTSGQASLFWLLLFAASFRAVERGSPLTAGAVLGVLVLKPTLGLGMALWWAIDPEHRRSLGAAAATSVAIIVSSVPFVGHLWPAYPEAALEFAGLHRNASAQWAQFSTWGFYDLLFPDSHAVATWCGAITAAAGVAAFTIYLRRTSPPVDVRFAAAVVLTLWVSPHLIAYDWALLVVPAAVVARRMPERARAWIIVAATLAIASVWSILIGNAMRAAMGVSFQFAAPVMGAAAIIVARLASMEGTTADMPKLSDDAPLRGQGWGRSVGKRITSRM